MTWFKSINYNFIYLLLAQIFNTIGAIFFNVAVISHVYESTNSVTGSSLILVLNTIATIIGGLIGSRFLDKTSNKKVMILSDFSSGLVIFLLALFFVYSDINILIIYLTAFITSIISSFFLPARSAIVPEIMKKGELVKANGLLVSSVQITMTAGWVIAVPVVLWIGIKNIVFLISITYFLSGLLVCLVQINKKPTISNKNNSSIFSDFVDGLKPIWNNKVIKSVTIMDMIETFANIVWVPTFMLAFTVEALSSGEEWWGYQGAAYFLGSILGGLIAAKYSSKIRYIGGKVMIFSSVSVTIITLLYGLNSVALLAIFFSLMIGLPYQIRNIVQESLIQEFTDESVLARVFAVRRMILNTLNVLALILGGMIADIWGIIPVYVIASAIYMIVAIYAYKSKVIRSLNFDSIESGKKEVVQ